MAFKVQEKVEVSIMLKIYVLKEAYTHEEMYDVGMSLDINNMKELKCAMESRRVHDDYPWYEIHEINGFSALEDLYIKNHPSDPLWRVVNRDGSYDAYQLDFGYELKLVNIVDNVTLMYSTAFTTPNGEIITRSPNKETAIKYGKLLLEETA